MLTSRVLHTKLKLWPFATFFLSAANPGIAAAQAEPEQKQEDAPEAVAKQDMGDPGDPAGRAARDTSRGVVKVGSKATDHLVTQTPAPVTVISGDDLVGLHGPDLLAPAVLRTLGSDRVLVLVNGKRRHQMAQINTDEVVGRGSAGTDLNAIPLAAIERVEILRDSAAAPYGPTAMAGVINIILKDRAGAEFAVTGGNYYDHDGNALFGLDSASASVNAGLSIGDAGFINLTLAVRDRGETNRAGIATVESNDEGIAFGGHWYSIDNTGCPPSELDPNVIPRCKPVRRLRFGNSDGQDLYLFYNGSYDFTPQITLYSFGGISRRTGNTGAGLFLGAGNGRVPAEGPGDPMPLYPDGFLPTLITTVDDISATGGMRFDLGSSWELDLSATFGMSRFNYDVENSVNTSFYYQPVDPAVPFGPRVLESPTNANAGQLINTEVTANADVTGEFELLPVDPLKVGAGAEFRVDNYEIAQGDFASYAYTRNNVIPRDNPITNPSALLIADVVGGIQGFPGFSPDAEVNNDRMAWGVYLDAEQKLVDWWRLGAAARFESVEFTGENISARLATRLDPWDFLGFRASASNGSRSPGVQQIYYSQRITAILPDGLTETATVGDANPLRAQFGMAQLKPEKSLSASAGIVLSPYVSGSVRSMSFSVDAYQIQIKDGIILSDSVTGLIPPGAPPGEVDTPGRQQFRDLRDELGVGAAQFFVNAVDTTTRGLDAVGSVGFGFGPLGVDFGAAFYYVETKIDATHGRSQTLTDVDLIGPIQRKRIEEGQPRYTATLAQATSYGPLSLRLALNYYGAVTGKAYMAIEDEKEWSGKWLTDASISYTPISDLVLTVGGNNIFDVYPDEWGAVGREYPEVGYTYGLETLPFGVNGGFYYLSAKYAL